MIALSLIHLQSINRSCLSPNYIPNATSYNHLPLHHSDLNQHHPPPTDSYLLSRIHPRHPTISSQEGGHILYTWFII